VLGECGAADNRAYIIEEWYSTHIEAEAAVAALGGNAIIVGTSGIECELRASVTAGAARCVHRSEAERIL